jgi:hypothetical protein
VRRKEQHQAQSSVDLGAGLEGCIGPLSEIVIQLRNVVVRGAVAFGQRHLVRLIVQFRIGGLGEVGSRHKPSVEGVSRFARTDDGRTRVFEHEHRQIVGIRIGDVDVFAVHIHGRCETS